MLSFAIFMLTIVVGLLGFLLYIFLTKKTLRTSKIPGPSIVDEKEGNLPDMRKAETFFDYLAGLHDELGSIVGFYLGQQYVVSIASPELFQEHSTTFDRPTLIFKPLEDIITPSSIQFANGAEGKRRHALYSRFFSGTAKFYPQFMECAQKTSLKLASQISDNKPIALHKAMFELSSSVMSKCGYGDVFTESELEEFIVLYNEWSAETEEKFRGNNISTTISNVNPTKKMRKIVEDALVRYRTTGKDVDGESYLNLIMNDDNLSSEAKFADAITMLIGGIHTTANLLTWTVYFLTQNEDVQNDLANELETYLSGGNDIVPEDIEKLTYLRQVVNESLRLGSIGPFAARISEEPVQLGGFTIPPGTPVLHVLAYVLQSEEYFQDADCFNPENFSSANIKARHPFAFKPFGFAGNRVCPGNKFAMHEVLVSLAHLFSQFRISLVGDQTVEPYYGFVTRPREEIWISVEKRH